MNEKYLKIAEKEALKALKKEEIPVGAVIVENDKIISKAYNTKEMKQCTINHAEINAIIKASKKKHDWRLNNCILYTTLEPCIMCMQCIIESRIKCIIYENVNFKSHDEITRMAFENNIEIKQSLRNNQYLRHFFDRKMDRAKIV